MINLQYKVYSLDHILLILDHCHITDYASFMGMLWANTPEVMGLLNRKQEKSELFEEYYVKMSLHVKLLK